MNLHITELKSSPLKRSTLTTMFENIKIFKAKKKKSRKLYIQPSRCYRPESKCSFDNEVLTINWNHKVLKALKDMTQVRCFFFIKLTKFPFKTTTVRPSVQRYKKKEKEKKERKKRKGKRQKAKKK